MNEFFWAAKCHVSLCDWSYPPKKLTWELNFDTEVLNPTHADNNMQTGCQIGVPGYQYANIFRSICDALIARKE